MAVAEGFVKNVNDVHSKLKVIEEARTLFSQGVIDVLLQMSNLDIVTIVQDLTKGNYLGNRKIDIDLILNNSSTTTEVTYKGVTITTNTGAVVQIDFLVDDGAGGFVVEELASYAAIYTKITEGIAAYNLAEADAQLHIVNTEIDIINDTLPDLPTLIRFRDTDGLASSIDRIQLQSYSGEPIETNPAYFWAKTTSSLQTLANRAGDIIALGNDIDSIIALASQTDEIGYLYADRAKLTGLTDSLYSELAKLQEIHPQLTAIATINNDMKVGGNNYINTLAEAVYKSKVETVAGATYKAVVETVAGSVYKALVETVGEATYKAQVGVVADATYKGLIQTVAETVFKGKIETVATNILPIQNAEANATTATNKAQEATDIVNEIKALGGTHTANTLIAGNPVTVSYDALTGLFTFNIPQGAKGERGESFSVNAIGNIADRTTYDGQLKNFSFFAVDAGEIYFKLSDTNADWSAGIPFGKGDDGVGISSVVKTGTAGLVDTYTITYSDASTSTYTVTNGAQGVGISSVVKTGTAGLVDTYTITYSDASTSTFNLTNGSDAPSLFHGEFGSEALLLASANPTSAGYTATVNSNGTDVVAYNWDNLDTKWVKQGTIATPTPTWKVGSEPANTNEESNQEVQIDLTGVDANTTHAVTFVSAELGDITSTITTNIGTAEETINTDGKFTYQMPKMTNTNDVTITVKATLDGVVSASLISTITVWDEPEAPLWVSGNTYTNVAPDVVKSPIDGLSYKCIVASTSGTTDPSADATNWTRHSIKYDAVGTLINDTNFPIRMSMVTAGYLLKGDLTDLAGLTALSTTSLTTTTNILGQEKLLISDGGVSVDTPITVAENAVTPIAKYLLDSTLDDSLSANVATLSGTAVYDVGQVNNGFKSNGSNGFSTASATNTIAISFWVYVPTTASASKQIFDTRSVGTAYLYHNTGETFFRDNGTLASFKVNGVTDTQTAGSITLDAWNFVEAVLPASMTGIIHFLKNEASIAYAETGTIIDELSLYDTTDTTSYTATFTAKNNAVTSAKKYNNISLTPLASITSGTINSFSTTTALAQYNQLAIVDGDGKVYIRTALTLGGTYDVTIADLDATKTVVSAYIITDAMELAITAINATSFSSTTPLGKGQLIQTKGASGWRTAEALGDVTESAGTYTATTTTDPSLGVKVVNPCAWTDTLTNNENWAKYAPFFRLPHANISDGNTPLTTPDRVVVTSPVVIGDNLLCSNAGGTFDSFGVTAVSSAGVDNNVVNNGSFDTDITGWTAINSNTLTWEAGELKADRTSGTSAYLGVQAITVEVGVEYTLTWDITQLLNGSNIRVRIGTTQDALDVLQTAPLGVGSHSATFTPTTTTIYFHIVEELSVTGISYWDNIKIYKTSLGAGGIEYTATLDGTPDATGTDVRIEPQNVGLGVPFNDLQSANSIIESYSAHDANNLNINFVQVADNAQTVTGDNSTIRFRVENGGEHKINVLQAVIDLEG